MKRAPWSKPSNRSVVIVDTTVPKSASNSNANSSSNSLNNNAPRKADSNSGEPLIDKLIFIDARQTERLYRWGKRNEIIQGISSILNALAHEGLWLMIIVCGVLLQSGENARNTWINLALGLIIDVLLGWLLRVLFEKPGPKHDGVSFFAPYQAEPFSFPASRVSRSTLLTLFFLQLNPFNFDQGLKFAILGFGILQPVAQVIIGKHYIGDVIFGAIFGAVYFGMLLILWMPSWLVEGIYWELKIIVPI